MYEINYELNNRPDWVWLPLQGMLQMLEAPEKPADVAAEAAQKADEMSKEA
jgi:predicted trehalose synthase